jgi:lambda family phage tail tape measure protein
MAAGSIVIDLLMKTGMFSTDVKRAEKEIQQLGKNIADFSKKAALATTAVATAFAYMAKQSINNMDALAKQAQMAGITVESLSALAYAADLSGVSQEELTASMVKLTKGMSDAKQGTGEALKGFQALGIEVSKLGSSDAVLEQLAEQFAGMEDGANKTALAVALFGRSGAQMIPFLNSGAEGLRQMNKEAAILGKVIGTDAAKGAEQFNDSLSRLSSIGTGLVNQFATGILPALNNMTQAFFNAYVESDQVRSEMNKLIGVNMVRWAENIAIALAHVVDVGVMVARVMVALGSSIRVVANDVLVLFNAMKFLTPAGVTDTMAVYEGLKQSIEDRKDALEFAADAYAQVFKSNGAFFANAVQESVELARLSKLLPSDEDFGAPGEGRKRNAPALVDTKTAGKQAEKLQEILISVFDINAEYAKSQEINLKNLALQDEMLGLTNDQKKVQEAINAVSKDAADRQEKLIKLQQDARANGASEAVLADIQAQIEALKEYEEQYKKLVQTQVESSIEAQRTFSFGWSQAFNQFVEDSSNQATKAGDMFNSLTSNMATAIDNFVETGKLSFGDFAKSVIKDLIKIELQARASKLLGMAIGAIGSAFSATTTAATHSGIGYGSGGDEFSELVRYSDGGYTGAGGKYEPAGIVHRGEYVLNANATKRIGVAALDRMNGYAQGGYVGDTGPAMQSGGGVTVNVINQSSQPVQASQGAPRFDGAKFVQDIILTDLRRNGPIGQALRTA